jgi:hypothetical protein
MTLVFHIIDSLAALLARLVYFLSPVYILFPGIVPSTYRAAGTGFGQAFQNFEVTLIDNGSFAKEINELDQKYCAWNNLCNPGLLGSRMLMPIQHVENSQLF